MEYLPLGDLHLLLTTFQEREEYCLYDVYFLRVIPECVIYHILFSCLSGLEFIHKNHIIHQDIKPHNILISEDGDVKICDFGISKVKIHSVRL